MLGGAVVGRVVEALTASLHATGSGFLSPSSPTQGVVSMHIVSSGVGLTAPMSAACLW